MDLSLNNDFDIAFISALVKKGTLEPAHLAGIKAEDLQKGAAQAFTFISKFFRKYGSMPDPVTVAKEIGLKKLPVVKEPLQFYLDAVVDRAQNKLLLGALAEAHKLIGNSETREEGRAILMKALSKSQKSDGIVEGRKAYSGWLKEFLVDVAGGGAKGIPTPWPTLTSKTTGVRPGEFWLTVARLKAGKCVQEDTLIPDPITGVWRTIKQVYEERAKNPGALTFNGGRIQGTTPTDYWDSGMKPCFEITTRSGWKISAPNNDPLLTPDGWVMIDKLEPGGQIAVAAYIPEPTRPVPMPWWEIDLLAGMLADGGTTGESAYFTKADPAIVQKMAAASEKIGCTLKQRGKKTNGHKIGPTRQLKWKQRSGIRLLLERFGVWGLLSVDKHIPDAVFSLSNDQLSRFIGMFWSCDGYILSNGDIGLGLSSHKMIEQIRQLLLRFGVSSLLRHKIAKCGGKKFNTWVLTVKGESKDAFLHSIPLTGEKMSLVDGILSTPRHPVFDYVNGTPALREKIEGIVSNSGKTWHDFWRSLGWSGELPNIRGLISPTSGHIPRIRLRAFVDFFGAERQLGDLVSDQIWWDEIVSITPLGKNHVYDLTIADSHNFVANGVIAHNTIGLCAWAKAAWEAEKSFVFFSAEMSAAHMEDRLYAILAGVDLGHVRNRCAPPETLKKLNDFKKLLKQRPPFWIYGPEQCQDAESIILGLRETKADIGYVDAVYRLAKDSGKKAMWEAVTQAVNSLTVGLAEIGIPVVASSQYNRDVKQDTEIAGAGVSKLGYAYAMGQAADALIFYHQDQDLRDQRQMQIVLDEYRYGGDVSLLVNWDLQAVNFSEIENQTMDDVLVPAAVPTATIAVGQSPTPPSLPSTTASNTVIPWS